MMLFYPIYNKVLLHKISERIKGLFGYCLLLKTENLLLKIL